MPCFGGFLLIAVCPVIVDLDIYLKLYKINAHKFHPFQCDTLPKLKAGCHLGSKVRAENFTCRVLHVFYHVVYCAQSQMHNPDCLHRCNNYSFWEWWMLLSTSASINPFNLSMSRSLIIKEPLLRMNCFLKHLKGFKLIF